MMVHTIPITGAAVAVVPKYSVGIRFWIVGVPGNAQRDRAAGTLHDLAKNRAQHKRREPLLDEADHTLHVVLRIGGKHVQPAGEGHQQRADRSGPKQGFSTECQKDQQRKADNNANQT